MMAQLVVVAIRSIYLNNYQKYMTNIKSKKVNLTSSNLTEEKLLELKQILPEVFAENKIDWDKLKTVLGNYADRTRKHSYPMAGFMRCGDCGSMLCGQMQKGHLYYSCSHRKDPKCIEKKYMRWEDVEAQVAVMLSRVQLPDKFKKVLDAYFQYFAKERLDQEDKERRSLKQELIRLQQQIRNIVVDRSKRIIDADVFIKIQDELLREKEMYQGRLGEMESKSDKFVQKFNELLDFTDHADRVFQTSGLQQKRTLMKLCFEGFIVRKQKLTPIWTPVFDVLMDLQVSKIEPPKPSQGSKSLANTSVQTWKSGGVF